MESWGNPISIGNNQAASGALKQFFPDWITVGSGSSAQGTLRRKPTSGTLYRIEITPTDAQGGIFELWDLAGLSEGASNNVDTGTAITNAYLTAAIAANQAKLIWRVDFKGDSANASKVWTTRVPFIRGLAGRYTNTAAADGTYTIALSIVADGGYVKVPISG